MTENISPPQDYVQLPPIKDYIGTDYYVNDSGDIWSAHSGRNIKSADDAGYKRYQLHCNGSVVSIAGHICVAAAYGSPLDRKKLNEGGYVVNHRNGNKSDNRIENLEVVTYKDNVRHALSLGLVNPSCRSALIPVPDDLLLTDAVEVYPGYYVFPDARIISTHCRPHLQKTWIDGFGYVCTSIVVDGKKRTRRVHKLVAEAFLEKPNIESVFVNHVDGNKLNNSLENLAYSTPSENAIHQCISGLHRVELPVSQYSLSGVYMDSYPSLAAASRKTGIPYGSLRHAAKRGIATHGYLWKLGYDPTPIPSPLSKQRSRPVNAYHATSGAFYKRYESETAAGLDLGISQQHIGQICTKAVVGGKHRYTAKGYTFRFARTACPSEIPKNLDVVNVILKKNSKGAG